MGAKKIIRFMNGGSGITNIDGVDHVTINVIEHDEGPPEKFTLIDRHFMKLHDYLEKVDKDSVF